MRRPPSAPSAIEMPRKGRTDRDRPALSPYVVDDVAFTLEEIRRARSPHGSW